MNRFTEQYDHDRDATDFHTHRSERYRHPDQHSSRLDEYRSSSRGGYGNQNYQDRWGDQRHESDSRRYSDMGSSPYDRYEQSRNYGNMGSYGGAQGFGDMRGGHHDSSHPFDSGTGTPRRYLNEGRGPQGDRGNYGQQGNSYNRQSNYGGSSRQGANQEDLYGQDLSRRFRGSRGQDSYDFERDDYYSSNYGDDQGNYMGSGYRRETESRYGTGDYGSSGHMDQNRPSGNRGQHEFNTSRNRWNTDW